MIIVETYTLKHNHNPRSEQNQEKYKKKLSFENWHFSSPKNHSLLHARVNVLLQTYYKIRHGRDIGADDKDIFYVLKTGT